MLIDTGEFRLSAVADYGELTFCRFAVFDCIETGERFAILNTALDRYSEEARTEGMQKLIAYADTLTCPIILAADLESTKIELPFLLATAYRFDNSFLLAEQSDGYEGRTENGAFGSEAALYYKSDFIFTSYGDFHIYSHTVDRRKIDGRYISNHWPLYLEFALKTYP